MSSFIFLIIGALIAGIPLGIVAIVHSGRSKGTVKGFLLPLSIIALLASLFAFVRLVSIGNDNIFFATYFGGLALSIVTLSIAVHYRRKANNKIFDDKAKEHHESVVHTNNQIKYFKEIKELKKLLDDGAITQEEYDKKKTEILNRK